MNRLIRGLMVLIGLALIVILAVVFRPLITGLAIMGWVAFLLLLVRPEGASLSIRAPGIPPLPREPQRRPNHRSHPGAPPKGEARKRQIQATKAKARNRKRIGGTRKGR